MPRCFQADSQVDPWGFHRLQEHLWEALTSQTLVTPLIRDRGRTLGTGLSAKVPGHRAHLRCHPLFMLTLHFCRVLDTPSVAAFEDMYGSKHVSKKFGNKGRMRGGVCEEWKRASICSITLARRSGALHNVQKPQASVPYERTTGMSGRAMPRRQARPPVQYNEQKFSCLA